MTVDPSTSRWRSDVLEAVHCVARRKFAVCATLAVALAAGVATHQASEPFYRASSTFVLLPREKPILDLTVQSTSVETAEDGAKRSASATLTLPPNPDLYTTLIRSGEVASGVAETLGAEGHGGRIRLTAGDIRAGLEVASTEEGVIKVAMIHEDPAVAARVVNEVVQACMSASKSIERQLIIQQAGFLGSAIEQAERRLDGSRARLDEFTMSFGVAEPSQTASRSAALISSLNDAEARLEQDHTRLLVHRTPQDPQSQAIAAELAQIRSQRDAVRASYCGRLSEAEFARIESEWLSLKQDVTLRQDLLMSMRARHDLFKIRADQPAGNLAVIRQATPPATPAGPSIRKAIVVCGIGGFFAAIGICVLGDQLERISRDAHHSAQFRQIRDCFAWPITRNQKEAKA